MTWVAIPGYEGRYAVSDAGEVMSMNYAKSGLPGIMTAGENRGYLAVSLQTGSVQKRFTIHRLVMLAFVGPRPHRMQINHKDGNKRNNALSNLEYVTPSDNQKHSFRLGLQSNKGSRHSGAKLTESDVLKIHAMLAAGDSQTAVGKLFGVDASNVCQIASGKRWPHVKAKVG